MTKTKIGKGLLEEAAAVLRVNDLGGWTRPAPDLYPHQWLWDSCFIAIGLSHIDIERAVTELETLLKGQWKNGMVPHVIFSENKGYHAGKKFWRAERSKQAGDGVYTTGITQPPVLAEALSRIGAKLGAKRRRKLLKRLLPKLISYHEWFYRERDPFDEGLVAAIHPWETGMDNTPPWVEALWKHRFSSGMRVAKQLGVHTLYERFRKDTKSVPASQRTSTADLLLYYELVRKLRGHKYDSTKILKRNGFAIYDVALNAILVRANSLLASMAKEAGIKLPDKLERSISKAAAALETLWSREAGTYLSRDFSTRHLISQPSVASLLPLYAGTISADHAAVLVSQLQDKQTYATPWPVPSTPPTSTYFKPLNYWQGPTWVNINWMLIDGLKRLGEDRLADSLKKRTLEMVKRSGFYEYFSPLDGQGAGSHPFSWTAALTIDLANQ